MSYPEKILISYLDFPPIAVELKEVFQKLGIQTELFLTSQNEHWFYKKVIKRINKLARNLRLVKKGHDFFLNHPLNRLNYLTLKFEEKYQQFQPDLVFIIHGIAFGDSYLASIKVPKIGWLTEPYDDIDLLSAYAVPFNQYNSFSQKAIDILNGAGFSADYLCHAFSPKSFYPMLNNIQNIDVSFVGNWSPWREEVLNAVLSVTKNISLYGPGWKKKSNISFDNLKKIYKGGKIVGDELNQLFNSSKVVLNISRDYGSSGLNMRFFEVPASGACLLTDWAPELEKHFVPEQHVSVFLGIEDLVLKVNKLLGDSDLRNYIRENGCNHVYKNYTYEAVAKRLLNQYSALVN